MSSKIVALHVLCWFGLFFKRKPQGNHFTCLGSPPKAATFSCTHRSAICWSSNPAFPVQEKSINIQIFHLLLLPVNRFDVEHAKLLRLLQRCKSESIVDLCWKVALATGGTRRGGRCSGVVGLWGGVDSLKTLPSRNCQQRKREN